MFETIRMIIAIILISCGVLFAVIAAIGLFRFKFVLNRMHTAALCDTLAIFFILMGLIVINGFNMTSLKLGMIIVLLWIASPVSSHLMSNLVTTVSKDKVLEECDIIEK